MLVPTFVVISDKWSVGKQELATKEAEVAELLDQACMHTLYTCIYI